MNSSDHRSSSATSPRQHHHHPHILERSSHRSSGHHHGHHHQLQHHNTWGGGGDMLQAATFALQASAFTSMSHSSSASGGSDPSSALSSEQQQFSLPCFSNSYFPNSPPCSIGDIDALPTNPNNPDICVTNVIGDEVLLLGGGKNTPQSSAIAPTQNSSLSATSAVAVNEGDTISDGASLLTASSTIATLSASTSKSMDVEPMDMDEDS